VCFRAWDLGGHQQVRTAWRDYFTEADAIIFVVDAGDHSRINEARQELENLRKESGLTTVKAFLVLANKTDLKSALGYEQLLEGLQISESDLGGKQSADKAPLQLFRCSLVDGTGYTEAFSWLSTIL